MQTINATKLNKSKLSESKIEINWLSSVNAIGKDLWLKTFPAHLEGFWWYSVLENSGLEDQFQFFYGLLTENDKPIGIVPAFIHNVPIELVAPEALAAALRVLSKIIPGCGYQRTFFIGSPCSDEGTIGLLPQYALVDIAATIHQAALQKAKELNAPMIVWKDFPQSCENALDPLCQNSPVFKMVSYPGTTLYLAEASIESYFKGLPGKRRHNLLKKLKRSKEKFPFIVSTMQNPDDQLLDEIFALFWQTYENGKTKFERLNRKFFSLIAQQKESWFILLQEPESKKVCAFMLCFLVEDKVINKFIGLDYQLVREANLYFRLWQAAVEWTTSLGIKILQSGQTGYRFKIETGSELEPLYNYCQNRNPLMNTIYAKIAKTISWSSLDKDLEDHLKAHPES